MALQIRFTDDFGMIHSAAYVRVRPSTLSLQEKRAQAEVFTFHNATAATGGKKPLWPVPSYIVEGALFDQYFNENNSKLVGVSLHTQWYAYLKTLSEFAGSVDV